MSMLEYPEINENVQKLSTTKSGSEKHEATEKMNRFLGLMWSHYDPEDLGTLDYQHLQELVEHYSGHTLNTSELKEDFKSLSKLLDEDNNGYFDREDVSNFASFGADMTNTEQKNTLPKASFIPL